MTSRRRSGGLSEEDVAVWRAVAETVEARAGSVLPELLRPASVEPAPAAVPGPRRGNLDPQQPARPESRRPPPLAELDRRTRGRITRGRIGIERRIDLHGLSQADAHAALRRFLAAAQAEDLRLVLVVTGKGERNRAGSEGGPGVLKRMVPHWLRELDLRGIVLGFEAAGAAHGGSGALYIRLRRRPGGEDR